MNINIIAALMILGLLIGFAAYTIGFYSGVKFSVDIGTALLKKQGIILELDNEMITRGLIQYKQQIGSCLFMEDNNASVLYVKGD